MNRGPLPSLRATIAVVLLVQVAHVVVLLVFATTPPGPFLSNACQLAMGTVCLAATLGAARGGEPFERRFLWLVGARFAMWMICQAIATYESYHESDSSFDGSVTNVVFHLEDLPLCIALFLNPGPLGTRLESARLPDLAQIVVFGLTVYFYCHFMPTSPDSGVARIVGSHVLVGVFFYFRAVTIRSDIGSAMFGRWTLALLLSVVNDAYSLNSELDPLTGEMFDLVWSSELMLWTLIAATWRQTRPMPAKDGRPAPDRALRVMPLVVACFTVVLSVSLAKYQPVVAAPMAAASLLCTALVLRSRNALAQNFARKNLGRTPSR